MDISIDNYTFRLKQGPPSPPWVELEIFQGADRNYSRVSMKPEDFRVLAAFIKSWTDTHVKTEKEIELGF